MQIDKKSQEEQRRLAAIEWVRKNTTEQFARGGDYVNAFIAGAEWMESRDALAECSAPEGEQGEGGGDG